MANSKKKRLETLEWCLNTIKETCGDWESLAVKEMEELEDEIILLEVMARREDKIKKTEEKKEEYRKNFERKKNDAEETEAEKTNVGGEDDNENTRDRRNFEKYRNGRQLE